MTIIVTLALLALTQHKHSIKHAPVLDISSFQYHWWRRYVFSESKLPGCTHICILHEESHRILVITHVLYFCILMLVRYTDELQQERNTLTWRQCVHDSSSYRTLLLPLQYVITFLPALYFGGYVTPANVLVYRIMWSLNTSLNLSEWMLPCLC